MARLWDARVSSKKRPAAKPNVIKLGLFENWRCVQQRGILGLWQAIFSHGILAEFKEKCAVHGAKDPPVGHVDHFYKQTLGQNRRKKRAASL